jgi:hypothetical protein
MKRTVLGLVVVSLVAVGAGYGGAFLSGGAPAWAPWALALGTNGALMSLMALGALRRDKLPTSLVLTFIGMFVLCGGAFAVALAMPANEGAGGPILLGLPVRTAILLYSVGVLPIVILPFAYALTFDKNTLSDEDLARVREAHARMVHEQRATSNEGAR